MTDKRAALKRLKKDFGVHGSWAIWGNEGSIRSVLMADGFQNKVKPNIVFLGLNASMEIPVDWINFHSECALHAEPQTKAKEWKNEPVRRLAEVLQEKEFAPLKGAYMSDIIKTSFDGDSAVTAKKAKDESVRLKNVSLLKKEIEDLSQVSGSDQFHYICIGGESYNIVTKAVKEGLLDGSKMHVHKIYHYSQPYRNTEEEIKRRIREDLFEVIKKMKKVNFIRS